MYKLMGCQGKLYYLGSGILWFDSSHTTNAGDLTPIALIAFMNKADVEVKPWGAHKVHC